MPHVSTPRDIQKLNAIRALLDRKKIDDALEKALEFTQTRPRIIDGWELLAEIAEAAGDAFITWLALRQLCHLDPQEYSYHYSLTLSALKLDCPYLTLKLIDDHLKRFPNSVQRDRLMEIRTIIQEDLKSNITQRNFPADVDLQALADLDEGRLWITYGETGEGRRALEKAARSLPKYPPVYNNLALSYIADGNLPKALEIVDQTLTVEQDNLFAQALRVQLLVRLGRADEARTLLYQIAQEIPTNPDHWIKLVEAAAYAHEHQLVLDICKRALAFKNDKESAFTTTIQHFIGTAHAFLGNLKQAQAAWKKVTPESLYHEVTQINRREHGDHGPFYFPLYSWIPPQWIEEIFRIVERNLKRSSDHMRRDLEKLMARHPGMRETLSLQFERGDPTGIEAALHLAEFIPLPGLLEFAGGIRGSSDHRITALKLAQHHGLIPKDQPFTMVINGKPTEIMPIEFEIYFDTDEHVAKIPAEAQAVIEAAHTAFMEKRYADALAKAEEGIASFPDQLTLHNFKANALHMLKRHDEADAITRWLAETHPDYFFGRIAMAGICLRENRLDEVEQWLAPLRGRKRYHISEFRGFALINYRLHVARKEYDEARRWVEMLDELDPDAVTDEMRLLVDIGRLSKRRRR